ncbi:hypothetical protein WJ91_12590 [Burkholderia ubonensis]|nr:hypothetical protein WJ91_12590 [Burkholderia ubonensis]
MLLFCPRCGTQHIDAPETKPDDLDDRVPVTTWTKPPHRSHLCHACGIIWRPADVATVGVAAIETHGKADTWTGGTPWIGHNRPVDASANETGAEGATVAWMHASDPRDCISDAKKRDMIEHAGTPGARLAENYSIPLGRLGTPMAAAPADELAVSDGAQTFACYLIDHCEGETITEEAILSWLGKMAQEPRYARAAASPAAEARVIGEIRIPDNGHPCAVLLTAYDERGNGWRAGTKIYAAPQPVQADAPVRTEALRKGLFEARDAMRVMSNWVKELDPAGYSWGIHIVHRANAVLNGEADTARADAPAEARLTDAEAGMLTLIVNYGCALVAGRQDEADAVFDRIRETVCAPADAGSGDAIARSKRILALVDDYHEKPTADSRTTLLQALMAEFETAPPAARMASLTDDAIAAMARQHATSFVDGDDAITDLFFEGDSYLEFARAIRNGADHDQ